MMSAGTRVILSNGSSIVRALATNGGAISMDAGTTLTIVNRCSIAVARAFASGAISVDGAHVTVSQHCTIEASATGRGGAAITLRGGVVLVSDCQIFHTTADHELFNIESGSIHLLRVTIEHSTVSVAPATSTATITVPSTTYEHGPFTLPHSGRLYSPGSYVQATKGLDPLLNVTSIQFRLRTCGSPLFNVAGGPFRMLFRNVSFVALDGCNASDLAANMEGPGVSTKGCEDEFTDGAGLPWRACASSSEGACTAHRLANSALESLTCRCPSPEFDNPLLDGGGTASSYLHPEGCVDPMMLRDYAVLSKNVAEALSKPDTMERNVSVTLYLRGTEVARPANWTIVNASSLSGRLVRRDGAVWLRPSVKSGETDAEAIRRAMLGDRSVVLSAAGLRERAAPYKETLMIEVRSAYDAVTRIQPVDVTLSVQAETHSVTWSRVVWVAAARPRCAPYSPLVLGSGTTAGAVRLVPFTACDRDQLPVDHQLPSQSDTRRFAAGCNATAGAEEQAAPIDYFGTGIYTLSLDIRQHGPFVCVLLLGGPEVGRLTGEAACPSDRVPLTDGACGCGAGFEGEPDTGCRECITGSFKPIAGNDPCTLCDVGTFQAAVGSSGCSRCALGHVQPLRGGIDCHPCDPGHLSASFGGVQCEVCAAGTVQVTQGSSACRACAAGEFQASRAADACNRCEVGQAS
eukprot:989610-Prymnesium_polylepis.1